MRGKFLKCIWMLVIACSAALSGCSVPLRLSMERSLAPIAIPAGHGLVVVRTHAARTNPTIGVSTWDTISFVDTKTDKLTELSNVAGAQTDYSVFIATLPAGNYSPRGVIAKRLVSNSMSASGYVPVTYSVSLDKMGSFQIKAGEITNLGTIAIVAKSEAQPTKGANIHALIPQTQQKVIAVHIEGLVEESSQLMTTLNTKLPSMKLRRSAEAWDVSESQKILNLPIFRQDISTLFTSPVVTREVSVSGEELGQLRVRQNKKWEWFDTGMSHAVRAVCALSDGTILVGASQGIVLAGKLGNPHWESHVLPLGDGVVSSIVYSDSLGIFAVVDNGDELVVFRKRTLPAPWMEERRIPMRMDRNSFYSREIISGATGDYFTVGVLQGGEHGNPPTQC